MEKGTVIGVGVIICDRRVGFGVLERERERRTERERKRELRSCRQAMAAAVRTDPRLLLHIVQR